ncbi:MAG: hypothetical protein PHS73_00445 [Candidatus Peribacteraceae bacterium]|nr:hypothetical protein [Candidatus Peribacteraceae bacterium]
MKIPSEDFCRDLFDRYAVPDTIRRHCDKVAEVGTFLAKKYRDTGVEIDVELVTIGCRLHDAFKAASLPKLEARPEWGYTPSEREIQVWRELRSRFTGMHETLVAAEMLRDEFPEFADFVSKIGSTGNPTYMTNRVELKILHYADWRVQFDQIISFDARLDYLREAYKHKWIDKGEGWWEQKLQEEKILERELFRHLPFAPDELAVAMAAEGS